MTAPSEWVACPAEWEGAECELGAGHDGSHEVTIVWDQDVTPKPPVNVEISAGYRHYLEALFSGTGGKPVFRPDANPHDPSLMHRGKGLRPRMTEAPNPNGNRAERRAAKRARRDG